MSSWLFLGYPALIFTTGISGAWVAFGLVVCMFLNLHFVAPRLRKITEATGSLTLSTYFAHRCHDSSGKIRIISAIMSIFFFTFYISSGLVGMGLLVHSLFHIPYTVGITIGLCFVVAYVFFGGYKTVAWIDLFQGVFLLIVIALIPLLLLRSTPLPPIIPSQQSIFSQLLLAASWGLGYFGQPHILTKFMGIKNPKEMYKAKYVGISWQTIALSSATLIGLLGISTLSQGHNAENIALDLVKITLPPFFSGLVLCAILAATTNVMAAQILVVASNISEDLYHRAFPTSPQKLLWISRLGVLFIAICTYLVAFFNVSSIYNLVFFSWSGLGASFGPLVLISLYRKVHPTGAFAGILVGGLVTALWYQFPLLPVEPLIAGFLLGSITILSISYIKTPRTA
jgi:sodium/proline symporter